MHLSDIGNPSKVEVIKQQSRGLCLPIFEDLASNSSSVSEESLHLLKFHGTYQQDDRDTRIARKRQGLDKEYSFMVRNRIPGGRLTADQFLAELDLAEKFGNGTLRLPARQSIQIHGVLKGNLREVIHAINRIGLSTQSACGDVNRNVMCCPAPFRQKSVRKRMFALANRLAEILRPKTRAYHDLWITDPKTGEKSNLLDPPEPDEPLYGALYLPRKFKVGIALCDDNCIDVYDQDIGILGITDVSPSRREDLESILFDHGIAPADALTPLRRRAFACPALPTCGLALTESERVLPGVVGQIQALLDERAMGGLALDVRMTGCPNGCARPYNAEIGLVGGGHHPKSGQGRYSIFLGGSPLGNRLAILFREKVLRDEIAPALSPALRHYAEKRIEGESFGDFFHRVGIKVLQALPVESGQPVTAS